jgi:hypothetical protein
MPQVSYNYSMKKRTEYNIKAERRDISKRPRMKVHSQNLKKQSKFSGFSALKAAKKKHGKK